MIIYVYIHMQIYIQIHKYMIEASIHSKDFNIDDKDDSRFHQDNVIWVNDSPTLEYKTTI